MAIKILGIDEAGRGAVIGPLVLCGALIDKSKIKKLTELKVRDSKLLSPNQRTILYGKILPVLDSFELIRISAKEIDEQRKKGISLNEIEAEKMATLVNNFKPETAYIDAIDPDAKTFKTRVNKFLRHDCKIIAEHEADVKYPIVSAASILAKVTRDEDIKALEPLYGNIGSGYPSDERTQKFLKTWLKENKKLPKIVRETWSTAEAFISKEKQKSLTEWLKEG